MSEFNIAKQETLEAVKTILEDMDFMNSLKQYLNSTIGTSGEKPLNEIIADGKTETRCIGRSDSLTRHTFSIASDITGLYFYKIGQFTALYNGEVYVYLDGGLYSGDGAYMDDALAIVYSTQSIANNPVNAFSGNERLFTPIIKYSNRDDEDGASGSVVALGFTNTGGNMKVKKGVTYYLYAYATQSVRGGLRIGSNTNIIVRYDIIANVTVVSSGIKQIIEETIYGREIARSTSSSTGGYMDIPINLMNEKKTILEILEESGTSLHEYDSTKITFLSPAPYRNHSAYIKYRLIEYY